MDNVDIWMPIVIGDYLGETQRLTTEQHGAYLLLMLDYWRNGPPPHDVETLKTITGLDSRAWRKNEAALLGLFYVQDGYLRNDKIEERLAAAKDNRRRASERARNAAKARWHGDKTAGGEDNRPTPSNARALPKEQREQSPSSPPSSSTPTHLNRPPSDDARAIGDIAAEALNGVQLRAESADQAEY